MARKRKNLNVLCDYSILWHGLRRIKRNLGNLRNGIPAEGSFPLPWKEMEPFPGKSVHPLSKGWKYGSCLAFKSALFVPVNNYYQNNSISSYFQYIEINSKYIKWNFSKTINHTVTIFCRLSVLWPYDFVEYKQKQLYQNMIYNICCHIFEPFPEPLNISKYPFYQHFTAPALSRVSTSRIWGISGILSWMV